MRILYICCDPGIPVFGRKGAASHVRGTCLALLNRGHDIRLLCANEEGDNLGRDQISRLVVPMPTSKKLGFDLRRWLLDRRMHRAALRTLLPTWQPDAIYERYSLYSRTGTRLAARLAVPHILEVNALLSQELRDRIRLPRWARASERRIIADARSIFVVSSPLQQSILEFANPARPIRIEPMSVDTELFSPRLDASTLRASLGIEDRFVIGYIGTLAGWHGIHFLYDLARNLLALGIRDFFILAVGDEGAKLERHRNRVRTEGLESHVRFHGAVPHTDIPLFLRAMDIGLIPDANPWNAPTKMFEYQAAGIPPIGPDYPGVRSGMDDGIEGLIFPPRNLHAMTQAVVKLYRDPRLRLRIGTLARARVEATRSWDRAAHVIVSEFEDQQGRDSNPTAA